MITVKITCNKDGVQFSAVGDTGTGKISLKQNAVIDKEDGQVKFINIHSCIYCKILPV